jgi:hypothetical protein
MKKRVILFSIYFFCLTAGFAQKKPAIEQAYVARVVQTLAADDMQGRGNFTPGLEKAADLLPANSSRLVYSPWPVNPATGRSFRFTGLKRKISRYRSTKRPFPKIRYW